MEKNKNLFRKTMDADTRLLLERFQQQVIMPYIRKNGNIGGYGGQTYLMLPKYDRRRKLYKGVSKDTYDKLYDYLIYQSQRYWRRQRYESNDIQQIQYFKEADHPFLCYERVWHSGMTAHGDPVHSASQLVALREGVEKYGFRYYENDYNMGSHHYAQIKQRARNDLVNYYRKILAQKFGNNLSEKPNKIN